MALDPSPESHKPNSPRPAVRKVFICTNGDCAERDTALGLFYRLQALVHENNLDSFDAPYRIKVSQCGCLDICEKGPVLVIQPDQVVYWQVDEIALEKIFTQHLLKDTLVRENIIRIGPQHGSG